MALVPLRTSPPFFRAADGHLAQVDFAREAVQRSAAVVGVVARDAVILAAERRTRGGGSAGGAAAAPSGAASAGGSSAAPQWPKLLVARSCSRIMRLDKHLACACAGLSADARVLFDKVRGAERVLRARARARQTLPARPLPPLRRRASSARALR